MVSSIRRGRGPFRCCLPRGLGRPDCVHLPSLQGVEGSVAAEREKLYAEAVGPRRIDALGQVVTTFGKDLHNAAVNEDAQLNRFAVRAPDSTALRLTILDRRTDTRAGNVQEQQPVRAHLYLWLC